MDAEFRACGVCTQTCSKEHGAHDAAPSSHLSTRPPCFLLSNLELSSNWTPIPKEFLDAQGESLRGTARLLGANGKEWSVEVGGPAKLLGFKGGWKSFISSSNIKRGDQMLFSLFSKNCFFVYVFNKLGVEVVAPAVAPAPTAVTIGKRKRQAEVQAEPVSFDDDDSSSSSSGSESSDESEYEGKDESESEGEVKFEGDGEPAKNRVKRKITGSVKKTKKAAALTGRTKDGTPIEPGSMTTTYESRRRKVTQAELDRTLETAQALKIKNPSCSIVMKPSHVYRGFWLNIPKQFARKFLPRHKTEIILQDIHGFEWPRTVWIQNDHHTGLSGGWAAFSKDHCLEEGDVCVYEIINSKDVSILVHIVRVVDVNLVPGTRGGWEKTYNIVYGAGMNRQGSSTRRSRFVKRKLPSKKGSLFDDDEELLDDDVPLSKLYKEKQLDTGNSDITSDEDVKPKILSMQPIPKIKQEPGMAKVKQVPGLVKVKSESGLKQEQYEDVKPTLAQLQESLKCEPMGCSSVTSNYPVSKVIWYPVVKMLARRQSVKFPDQHDFLVALGGCVTPPSSQSSSICEDGNFNWWVPRTHLSPDLATCYFD